MKLFKKYIEKMGLLTTVQNLMDQQDCHHMDLKGKFT